MQAVEQRKAEIFLKSMDLAADGSLGDPQFLGRACEACQAGRSLEGREGSHGGQLSFQALHRTSLVRGLFITSGNVKAANLCG